MAATAASAILAICCRNGTEVCPCSQRTRFHTPATRGNAPHSSEVKTKVPFTRTAPTLMKTRIVACNLTLHSRELLNRTVAGRCSPHYKTKTLQRHSINDNSKRNQRVRLAYLLAWSCSRRSVVANAQPCLVWDFDGAAPRAQFPLLRKRPGATVWMYGDS